MIRLKSIKDIRVVKDGASISNRDHALIVDVLTENNQLTPVALSIPEEDINTVAERLRLAVDNAKSENVSLCDISILPNDTELMYPIISLYHLVTCMQRLQGYLRDTVIDPPLYYQPIHLDHLMRREGKRNAFHSEHWVHRVLQLLQDDL